MHFRSPSSRRAWIEIYKRSLCCGRHRCRPPRGGRGLKYLRSLCIDRVCLSPSSRRAWIEIGHVLAVIDGEWWSPSSRRAWIEICSRRELQQRRIGRPPRGGRGLKSAGSPRSCAAPGSPSSRRAWIEILSSAAKPSLARSPSSRRAWIEILTRSPIVMELTSSPSSRRAWIEIVNDFYGFTSTLGRPPRGGRGLKSIVPLWGSDLHQVALLAEGVD